MWIVTSVNLNTGAGLAQLMLTNGVVRIFDSENADIDTDPENGRIKERNVDTWVVHHEDDVKPVTTMLAKNFVGMDISVFELRSVSVCQPGEIKTKEVSKDGILPT
jgi:hypothetical protein